MCVVEEAVEIGVGETWVVSLDGELRQVKVVGSGEMPGWWKCIDVETGVEFSAHARWFVAKAD